LGLVFLSVLAETDNAGRWETRRDDLINLVNTKKVGWKAGINEFIRDHTHAKRLMGTILDEPHPLPKLSAREREIHSTVTPPSSFDSRTAWPGCIGEVMNQAECGSCWAFGCSESLSDRFCIHSNGTINVTLSPLDLVTCDRLSQGCNGGSPGQAWSFTKVEGIVTYACYPYNASIPTCPPQQQPCLKFVATPACKPECVNNETWAASKHYSRKVYGVPDNINDIETEIYTNGPVEAAFEVYEDFLTYKSGVYQHINGSLVGGHAVKIIGWGVDSGEDYWLVQNSWTTYWGMDGYFMILKGVDECGIESAITAGLPRTSS